MKNYNEYKLEVRTYSNVEDEDVGVEPEGNKDWEDRDKLVDAYLSSLPGTDLLSLHPRRLAKFVRSGLLDAECSPLALFVTNLTLASGRADWFSALLLHIIRMNIIETPFIYISLILSTI